MLAVLLTGLSGSAIAAQEAPAPAVEGETVQTGQRVSAAGRFLAGALLALGAHEAGHVSLDLAFDAEPRVTGVDFHGIPFFAITHRPDLSPRRALAVASAGFWVQHVGNEWILTRRPPLRRKRSPVVKGMLAFNLATSAAYAGAAFARTGPPERDTRGVAVAARIDERWVGGLVLAPAALDAWRYFHPESRWAAWASRGVKTGMLLLLFR